MPRHYSTQQVEAFLLRHGFALVRQRGSHRRYRGFFREHMHYVTLVAGTKQIPDGTLSGIASQLGVPVNELKRLIDSDYT